MRKNGGDTIKLTLPFRSKFVLNIEKVFDILLAEVMK